MIGGSETGRKDSVENRHFSNLPSHFIFELVVKHFASQTKTGKTFKISAWKLYVKKRLLSVNITKS